MKARTPVLAAVMVAAAACGGSSPADDESETEGAPEASPLFRDATVENLPVADVEGLSMDARPGDVDGDGDPDLLIANVRAFVDEADPANRLLINDGSGTFRDATEEVFPEGTIGTSFDAEFADFDGDGLRDLYLASRGSVDRLLLARPR